MPSSNTVTCYCPKQPTQAPHKQQIEHYNQNSEINILAIRYTRGLNVCLSLWTRMFSVLNNVTWDNKCNTTQYVNQTILYVHECDLYQWLLATRKISQ